MKTEHIAPGDVIWSNNEDLLTDEDCLPVIGTCQISSILSTLEPSEKIEPPTPEKPPKQNRYAILRESGAKFEKKSNLKNDYLEDILYYVCKECPFLSINKSKIDEHVDNAHNNKNVVLKRPHLKCPGCPNIFSHKMSLKAHLNHDHGVNNSDMALILQMVVYSAKSKEKNLAQTQQNRSESSSEENSLERDEFPQLVAKTTHQVMEKIMGTKKFQTCPVPVCKVALLNPDNMDYHITCHKDSGFNCPVCSEFFVSWKQLSSHLWRLHKIDMELYSCDKCTYKSVSLAKLNNIHKLIHGDVRAYSCTICTKTFKNSKQLANHKITHKKFERLKFKCEICSKSFSDKRQQKIHMNVVHEKIKPFLCNYCGYKGSSRSSLKMHIRQHTGEKPFACDHCSYATSDHNSLRRHKWRHTGQKPYKCSFCSYACIQSSTYKVHIKTKHPGQEKDLMFTCQECQFRSVNKEMYVAHMITVHDQKPQS